MRANIRSEFLGACHKHGQSVATGCVEAKLSRCIEAVMLQCFLCNDILKRQARTGAPWYPAFPSIRPTRRLLRDTPEVAACPGPGCSTQPPTRGEHCKSRTTLPKGSTTTITGAATKGVPNDCPTRPNGNSARSAHLPQYIILAWLGRVSPFFMPFSCQLAKKIAKATDLA